MIVFERIVRLDASGRFKLYPQANGMAIYYTAKGSAKKAEITAAGNLSRVEAVSYCDEAFPISGGIIYRIRNDLVIKK